MYSNAEKKNKSKNTPSIFQLASKVQQEVEGKDEAALIMNAYRRVEDIRVLSSNSYDGIKKTKQGAQQIRKPESSYANKVKETLKQLNANRKKEIEVSRQPPKPVTNEKISNKGPAERHLIQNGLKRLIKILDKKYDKNIAYGLQQILNVGSLTSSRYDEMIRLWKLRRMFSGWQYETMLLKIQKEKQVKIQKQKEKNQNRLAEDFHYFWSIKNFFKSWNSHVRRQLKKRQLELQENLKRQEQLKALLEQKNNHGQQERKRQIKANVELQNKLRGFLDGLKQQINGKQRLNTVKQKTEQQEMKQDSQRGLDGHQENENQVIQQNQHENVPQNNEVAQERQESEYHGPLTNEDLEKKRKQLQKKAKQRKQALQKLKKDREKKKKQEQQQKQAIERQIEEQQKKARQEQYRRFLKLKKEQEQWKARQKQLQKQADQFNRLRVMKFHGWIYWTKLKKTNQQRNKYIASLLTAIFMKRALENFVNGIMQRGEINLKKKQEKMNEYFRRNLKKRCVKKLEQWRNQQKQLKEELQIRHQVNSLKIYFKEWQRCRNQIQLQNYEWERPRIKRAECLHGMTLLHKAWQSLKLNRDREIENRNVQEHKAKIKEKFHKIVEQQPTINYDDFL